MADNNDIDASVKAFTELNTKEEMKAYLKKVNEENGLSRRNKLKITGSRAVLERYYREYLEGGTATAEHTKASVKKNAAGPSKRAASSDEQTSTTATQAAASASADGLVSSLIAKKNMRVSRTTIECLETLDSPFRDNCKPKPKSVDISSALEHLETVVDLFVMARDKIDTNLSHKHAINIETLRMEMQAGTAGLVASDVWSTFLKAWGIEQLPEEQPQEDVDEDAKKEQQAEIRVVWNALLYATKKWGETFPAPPTDLISWPIDFDERERAAVRKAARDHVLANPHLLAKDVSQEDKTEATSALKDAWPISKGRIISIAEAALRAAMSINRQDQAGRARSRSNAGSVDSEQSRDTSATRINDDPEDMLLDLVPAAATSSTALAGHNKRRRQKDADQDDEEEEAEVRVRKRPFGHTPSRDQESGGQDLEALAFEETLAHGDRLARARAGKRRADPPPGFGVAGEDDQDMENVALQAQRGSAMPRGRSRVPRPATAAQSGHSRYRSPTKTAKGDVSLDSIEEDEEEE